MPAPVRSVGLIVAIIADYRNNNNETKQLMLRRKIYPRKQHKMFFPTLAFMDKLVFIAARHKRTTKEIP
jgi:hypothetical protein